MIEVLKAGLYDTIQDLGRLGFQSFGVPISGAMDAYASALANTLVGNTPNAAVMEITVMGPKLKFHCDTRIAITGAFINPYLNGELIKTNAAMSVKVSDVLSFGVLEYGCRAYLSVFGGFLSEEKMGSRSMYQGITTHYRLQKGDLLPISEVTRNTIPSLSSIKISKKRFLSEDLEVYKGPEFDALSLQQQDVLSSQKFTVSKDSNRMAYQFKECFDNELKPIITSLVLPGTVQLTPSGQLIVLMRDCQTTGGYPRVLQLTEMAIQLLSQKYVEDQIQFKCLTK